MTDHSKENVSSLNFKSCIKDASGVQLEYSSLVNKHTWDLYLALKLKVMLV